MTGAALLGACAGSSKSADTGNGGGGGVATGGTSGTGGAPVGACSVYPQETEGPFYQDLDLVRSDITEGRPGTPLSIEVSVVRASDCAPVANAAVDIWQCDAGGVYSGYPGQLGGLDTTGQKWLRGTQVTDADGIVKFVSVYPGWYPGRTTHIHFKVHFTPTTESVSQMYFPEDVTTTVYQTEPYAPRGQKDTSNDADGIAHTGGFPGLLAVTQTSTGYEAKLTIVVLG